MGNITFEPFLDSVLQRSAIMGPYTGFSCYSFAEVHQHAASLTSPDAM